jgi:hypothetical protein
VAGLAEHPLPAQLAADVGAQRVAALGLPVAEQLEKYVSSGFLKPSYWRLRGKFDVPTERFTSYPQTRAHDNGILLGWAGWDYLEQEHALADLIAETLTAEAADKDAAVVLLAALHELQQWGTPFVDRHGRQVRLRCSDGWISLASRWTTW